jgi:hypothetical protein
MRKVNKNMRHLWSQDMEEALNAQHEALRQTPKALLPGGRNWRGLVRTVLVICVIAALFLILCAEVFSSDGLL